MRLLDHLSDVAEIKCLTAATGLSAASWLTDLSIQFLGVPLAVVFASIAGALFSLSFISPARFSRMVVVFLSSSFAGAYMQPVTSYYAGLAPQFQIGVAFAVAAAIQFVVPWAIQGFPGVERFVPWVKK